MGQAQFRVTERTYRPTVVFGTDGKKKYLGKLYLAGETYVCDEEEAPKHALSRALEPLNEEAKKAREVAKANLPPPAEDADALRKRLEAAEKRAADAEAQVEALTSPKPKGRRGSELD